MPLFCKIKIKVSFSNFNHFSRSCKSLIEFVVEENFGEASDWGIGEAETAFG